MAKIYVGVTEWDPYTKYKNNSVVVFENNIYILVGTPISKQEAIYKYTINTEREDTVVHKCKRCGTMCGAHYPHCHETTITRYNVLTKVPIDRNKYAEPTLDPSWIRVVLENEISLIKEKTNELDQKVTNFENRKYKIKDLDAFGNEIISEIIQE